MGVGIFPASLVVVALLAVLAAVDILVSLPDLSSPVSHRLVVSRRLVSFGEPLSSLVSVVVASLL